MGIRETLNQNPSITTGATVAIILAAVGVIGWQMFSGPERSRGASKFFYSDDDGKTVFTDEAGKITPFDRGGKPAVQAMVFSCDGGKTRFTAYLLKYTPAAKNIMDEVKAGRIDPAKDPRAFAAQRDGRMAKKPGAPETAWVYQADMKSWESVTDVKCPGDGVVDAVSAD